MTDAFARSEQTVTNGAARRKEVQEDGICKSILRDA